MSNMKSTSPQQVQQETAKLTRRLFRAPDPKTLLTPIILISLAIGFLFLGINWEALSLGVFAFAIPSLLAAILSTPLAQLLGGRHYVRRSFLLVFVSLAMVSAVFVVWKLILYFFDDGSMLVPVLIFGVSSTLWIRQITLCTTSQPSMMKSLPVASTQPVFSYVAVAVLYDLTATDLALLVVFFLIFSLAASLFIISTNLPFKHSFGIDGIKWSPFFLIT